MKLSLLASSVALLLAACSSTPVEQSDSGESDLSGAACAGDACAYLATPQALVRGGIVAAGHQLWWIAAGTTRDANGQVIDQLQRCDLPACASVTASLPLAASGLSFIASGLQAAGDNVFLVGWKQDNAGLTLFLTDGTTLAELAEQVSDQHDKYSVDANGLLLYREDRRTDGWASSTIQMCPFDGLALAKTCATYSDPSLNMISGIALTPTRVVIEDSSAGRSYDRATLGDRRAASMWSEDGGAALVNVGEVLVTSAIVVDTPGGVVQHDTTLRVGGSETSGHVDGSAQATATDGSLLFVGTAGEGDVFERPGAGVIATFDPSSGAVDVLATAQDVRSVTWDEKQLYWLDKAWNGAVSIGDSPGVVRTVAR